MIKTAAILAAGFGSRLGELTKNKPKSFLNLGGATLIERSINNLCYFGIEKIFIGTGYLGDDFKILTERSDCKIICVENEQYSNSGSMHTLFKMREHLDHDFLLLEADLLYEKKAIEKLIFSPRQNIVLGSGATNSGDEVYIFTNEDLSLKSMTKNKQFAHLAYAELAGISKISLKTADKMYKTYESQNTLRIDYEYVMCKVTKPDNFTVLKVQNLNWCEIDDTNHLERAKKLILPKIIAADEQNYD